MSHSPPFCPNPACPNHTRPEALGWYRSLGWYDTLVHGRIKRYACRRCGKSFSDQTFHLSYYLHLDIDFHDLLNRLCACSGVRAMARSFKVTDKVIANRIGRLARQAIGAMAELRCSQDCEEELVASGFESFIRFQDSPIDIHHLIGKDSQYVHACDLAFLRRDLAFYKCDLTQPQMTDEQKRKRAQLESGEPSVSGEVYASFERICHTIDDLAGRKGSIVLHTDEKKEYRAVLEANGHLDGKVTHLTTSSRAARTYDNPLWAANYYDRELRKDQAAQVRETTRWSQETNNCLERMYAYAGYHNFWKPFRIRQRDNRTHAEVAGFDVKRIQSLLGTFFTARYFFSKVLVNASEWLVWLRACRTPFRPRYQYLPGYVTCRERLIKQARAA